jgi:nicotinamide-nucleotide amidase
MICASIITIGDELLIGQIIDTNSAWLGQELNLIGVWCKCRIAVGDNKKDILNALDFALTQSEIVIITGGLGPTADDITKPLLCDYFGGQFIINEKVKAHVIQFFEKRNRPVLEVNIAQAKVPDNCEVLWNQYGTAPGMLFKKEKKIIFSLPGVPLEMKNIMITSGLEIIKSNFKTPKVLHRSLLTAGKGESFVAIMLKNFETQLPSNIKLAYLPKLALLRLRLTGIDTEEIELDNYFAQLQQLVAPILVSNVDVELEEAIGKLLLEKQLTISTAESCTGGAISSRITNVSGSSRYYKGSIIPYNESIKQSHLNVDLEILISQTAVSEAVAIQMAEHCQQLLKTDLAISITGYFEHKDKELNGLIFIAVSNGEKTETLKSYLSYDRLNSKELAVNLALNQLRIFVLKNY